MPDLSPDPEVDYDALIEDNLGLTDGMKASIAHDHGYLDPDWEEVEGSADFDPPEDSDD